MKELILTGINIEAISDPIAAFSDGEIDKIVDKIEAAARSLVADTESREGRRTIASNANKVARSKVYLDNIGKELVAERRKQIQLVDESRRKMRGRLDSLKAEIREPLTQWEDAQKARIAGIEERLEKEFASHGNISTISGFEAEIERISSIAIDESWQEFKGQAERLKSDTLASLNAAKAEATIKKMEADQKAAAAEAQALKDALEAAKRAQAEAEEAAKRAQAEAEEAAKRAQAEAEAKESAENAVSPPGNDVSASLPCADATEEEEENARIAGEKDRAISDLKEAEKMAYEDFMAAGLDHRNARLACQAIAQGRIRCVTMMEL